MTDTDPPPAPEEPQVEIHKPKPIRNWREFLKEVGIIVLGVSIALAAEQAVEWVHWRNQVRDAKEVIATELASDLVVAVTRMRSQHCTERRLDQLALILDTAAKSGSLPPLGDIHRPPRGIWPTGAWDSVVASQTATHFSRQQLADIAAAYKFVQRLENYTAAELTDWATLYTMVGPGRRLDSASESELRKALSEARSMSRTNASLGLQMANRVKNLGLPFSNDDLQRIANAKRPPASAAPDDICLPIGPVTASYGQSALSALSGDDVNQFPDFSDGAR